MGYLTSKKQSNLGVSPKRLEEAKDGGPAKFAKADAKLIAPGETFKADDYDIPKSWIDLGWLAPATADEEAVAKDREAQAEKLGASAESLKPADPAPVEPKADESHSSRRRT
jgi:hypothetical protein